jgi:hypothetical protein
LMLDQVGSVSRRMMMMARACTFQALDRRARACQTKSTLREETIHVHVHLERTNNCFFIINKIKKEYISIFQTLHTTMYV